MGLPGCRVSLQGLLVHIGQHQHLAGFGILDNGRDQAAVRHT